MSLDRVAQPLPPLVAAWWRSLDRWILFSLLFLVGCGIWLIVAASPAVTAQHHWSTFFLLKKHLLFLGPGIVILLVTSFLGHQSHIKSVQRVALFSFIAVCAVLWCGQDIKGARRWLNFGFFSLQPSEFLKPALSVLTAHVLSVYGTERGTWGFAITGGIVALCCIPLLLQPDLGMVFLLVSVWFCQCFIAGLSWLWLGAIGGAACCALLSIYFCFPHAAARIHGFLSNDIMQDPFGSHYQIIRAMKGFAAGGMWGKGPGAGTLLDTLPDGHADFIFAVAGEEMGLIACLLILGFYGVIVFRGLRAVFREGDPFYCWAILGLVMQLMLQVGCNIGSVLRLMPTKGMTLPFISYGGSSFLSLCWGMGMLLSFTRRYHTP